ncbi:MAG: hypothetical protein GXO70_02490 [Acidobacteria bacterium]|nr:hypothetical protein [Acidobacteriota bacterium]
MFQAILNDRTSGSSVLLSKTLDFMKSLAASGKPFPEGMPERLIKAHSGMACFIHLKRFFSENRLSETSLNEFCRQIAREEEIMLQSFRVSFPGEIRHVAVYSFSGMVLKALAALNRPLKVDVALCGPDGEGLAMAQRLDGISGVMPCLWGDCPYFSRILEVEAIILGCDAVSPGWFVNRSGTRSLIALAVGAKVPVYLAQGPLKSLTDDELIRMPLKQGIDIPEVGISGIKWENPLLEVVGTEGVIVSGMSER